MAAVLDQIIIATIAAHQPLNMSVLSRKSSLLRMLQENSREDSGSPIKVKFRHERNNGGSYDRYDRFNTAHVEQFAEGSLEWKFNYVNVTVDEATLLRNAGMNIGDLMRINDIRTLPARTQTTLFNIFGQEMAGALEDMSTLLAVQSWGDGTGNSTKDITGIQAIANSSSTHTYAGIAGGELNTFGYAGFLSGVNDNLWAARFSSTAQSVDLDIIGNALNDANQGSADGVKWIFCPLDIWTTIELLLDGHETKQNERASQIGFTRNIEWVSQGATFFADPYCPRNSIYGINPEHTYMVVDPALNMEFSGFKEPTDQAAITGQLKIKSQLVCDDRAKNFRLDNITAD